MSKYYNKNVLNVFTPSGPGYDRKVKMNSMATFRSNIKNIDFDKPSFRYSSYINIHIRAQTAYYYIFSNTISIILKTTPLPSSYPFLYINLLFF